MVCGTLFLKWYHFTPTNDISNISDIVNDSGMANDGMEVNLNKKAYHSSWAMTQFASIALEKFPDRKSY